MSKPSLHISYFLFLLSLLTPFTLTAQNLNPIKDEMQIRLDSIEQEIRDLDFIVSLFNLDSTDVSIRTKRDKLSAERVKWIAKKKEKIPIIEALKPVLYLYPEKEMDIDIQLQPFGEFSFTYPKYTDGWSAQIFPNGNIQIDGRNYPYLFWEGKLKGIAAEVRQSGFVIKAEETVAFLEEKLELMGLNEREMTDLITFWAPKLEENPYNYIHFVTGDDYENQIAQLQLS